MNKYFKIAQNEDGFVLVASLVTLGLLVIIGISATTTTNIEIQIAGNEKAYNMAFYQADGGNELGIEILEQNIFCPTGFHDTDDADSTDGEMIIGGASSDEFNMLVQTLDFSYNERENTVYEPLTEGELAAIAAADLIDAQIPDMVIPADYDPNVGGPHTIISFAGITSPGKGSALNIAAGYEGPGKGIGQYGSYSYYDVTARHIGGGNSESVVHQQWVHAIGQEGDCNY